MKFEFDLLFVRGVRLWFTTVGTHMDTVHFILMLTNGYTPTDTLISPCGRSILCSSIFAHWCNHTMLTTMECEYTSCDRFSWPRVHFVIVIRWSVYVCARANHWKHEHEFRGVLFYSPCRVSVWCARCHIDTEIEMHDLRLRSAQLVSRAKCQCLHSEN